MTAFSAGKVQNLHWTCVRNRKSLECVTISMIPLKSMLSGSPWIIVVGSRLRPSESSAANWKEAPLARSCSNTLIWTMSGWWCPLKKRGLTGFCEVGRIYHGQLIVQRLQVQRYIAGLIPVHRAQTKYSYFLQNLTYFEWPLADSMYINAQKSNCCSCKLHMIYFILSFKITIRWITNVINSKKRKKGNSSLPLSISPLILLNPLKKAHIKLMRGTPSREFGYEQKWIYSRKVNAWPKCLNIISKRRSVVS